MLFAPLQKAAKQLPATVRRTTFEPKCELLKMQLKMLHLKRSLTCAKKPTLQQRSNLMNSRPDRPTLVAL